MVMVEVAEAEKKRLVLHAGRKRHEHDFLRRGVTRKVADGKAHEKKTRRGGHGGQAEEIGGGTETALNAPHRPRGHADNLKSGLPPVSSCCWRGGMV